MADIEDTLNEESNEELDTLNEESEEGSEEESGKTTPEKRYKDLQGWATKLSQENKSLKSDLDQMKGQMQMLAQVQAKGGDTQEAQESITAFLDSEELDDALRDDPSTAKKLIKQATERLEASLKSEVVKLLDVRDAALASQFTSKQRINPAVEDKVEELRAKDAFKDLPEQTLISMAADLLGEPAEVKPSPRGAAGGRRVPMPKAASAVEKQANAIYEHIYGKKA